jgi:hypothetical protein
VEERPYPPGGQGVAVLLIEDETPRRLRVPSGTSAEHPNGATGVSRLLIFAGNLAEFRRALAALAGSAETTENTSLLGRHELAIVTPDGAEDPGERRLELSGPGPFAVEIATDTVRRGKPDPKLTCGVRIYLEQEKKPLLDAEVEPFLIGPTA